MADQVVVVGRGKVLADASVDELIARASGDEVLVRTSAPTEAARVLQRSGAPRRSSARNTLSVSGLGPQHVVEVLGQARVPFSEVTAQRATLEDVYLQLTGGEAEFRAGSDTEARTMTAASTPPHATTQPPAGGFGPTLQVGVDQVPHGPGLDDRPRHRRRCLCVAFTFLVANGKHQGSCTGPSPSQATCQVGHPFVPTGPDGEAVADSYQFVEQSLTGNGTITARVTSLTGVISTNPANVRHPRSRPPDRGWRRGPKRASCSRTSTQQGSPYAAIMATGSHGVRFQYNYTHDQHRADRDVVPALATTDPHRRHPHRLRLHQRTGRGPTIGTAHLSGLPATVIVGLFVTSPVSFQGSSSGAPTQATATFDHIALDANSTTDTWQSHSIGTGPQDFYPTFGSGSAQRPNSTFVLTGSGDIAAAVGLVGGDTASNSLLFGLIVAADRDHRDRRHVHHGRTNVIVCATPQPLAWNKGIVCSITSSKRA